MLSSRALLRLLPIALIALMICACGNKGDLVKPTPTPEKPQQQSPTPPSVASPDAAVPATSGH